VPKHNSWRPTHSACSNRGCILGSAARLLHGSCGPNRPALVLGRHAHSERVAVQVCQIYLAVAVYNEKFYDYGAVAANPRK